MELITAEMIGAQALSWVEYGGCAAGEAAFYKACVMEMFRNARSAGQKKDPLKQKRAFA